MSKSKLKWTRTLTSKPHFHFFQVLSSHWTFIEKRKKVYRDNSIIHWNHFQTLLEVKKWKWKVWLHPFLGFNNLMERTVAVSYNPDWKMWTSLAASCAVFYRYWYLWNKWCYWYQWKKCIMWELIPPSNFLHLCSYFYGVILPSKISVVSVLCTME